MYSKYRIVESSASSVSQYEWYHDQVYGYTPIEHIANHWDMLYFFWPITWKYVFDSHYQFKNFIICQH